MGKQVKKSLNYEAFKSIAMFKKAIETRPNTPHYRNNHSSEDRDKEFTGTETLEEANNLFVNGYTDTLEDIKKQNKTVVQKTDTVIKTKFKALPVGVIPIVPRVLNGHPCNMVAPQKMPRELKVIHLYYDVTCSCCVDASDIKRAGICVAGLIAMLEKQGYKIKIEMGFSSVDDDIDLCKILLKDYSDYLNIKKLCYPLTHPSFFRRHMFKWLETSPVTKKWHSGYGHALFYDYEENEIISFLKSKNVLDSRAYYLYYGLIQKAHYDSKELWEALKRQDTK